MYKYETHLHTKPVSICGEATVFETLDFYKQQEYDGVFITNHFLDGNINIAPETSYEEKIEFYFSDYEKGVKYGKRIGLKVFCGVELSYKGTDFLVYGLDKKWFLNNPQIMNMKKSEELAYMMNNGALVIQAHPFRAGSYIDHVRLFPKQVHGIEVVNALRTDFENHMAKLYAENYGLVDFAGSDNHWGRAQKVFAGMCSETPVLNEEDFIKRIKNRKMNIFALKIQ